MPRLGGPFAELHGLGSEIHFELLGSKICQSFLEWKRALYLENTKISLPLHRLHPPPPDPPLGLYFPSPRRTEKVKGWGWVIISQDRGSGVGGGRRWLGGGGQGKEGGWEEGSLLIELKIQNVLFMCFFKILTPYPRSARTY